MLKQKTFLLLALLLSTTLFVACDTGGDPTDAGDEPEPSAPADGGDDEDAGVEDAGEPEGPPPIDAGPVEGELVTTVDNGDGTSTTSVVSAGQPWVLIDFESGAAGPIEVADDTMSDAWDIGFQRFKVKVNGGASGSADAAVAVVTGSTFEAVTDIPAADAFLQDLEDDDLDGSPEFQMSEDELSPWYDYDMNTHVLTPNSNIYVIRTVEGAYFKMGFLGYYDDDSGEGGYPSFMWAPLAAPASDAGVVDAGPATDAGADMDAGPTVDAGHTDAGSTDAGSTDAGHTDAGN